jgi:hypothetical protein
MPYTGTDVLEMKSRDLQDAGSGTLEGGTEPKKYRVDWPNRHRFVSAMLGIATLADNAAMVAKTYKIQGQGPADPSGPGMGRFRWALIEIGYEPAQTSSSGSSTQSQATVTYEEETDYGSETLALPTDMFRMTKDKTGAKKWIKIPQGAVGFESPFIRRIYQIQGLKSTLFTPAINVKIQKRINSVPMLGVDKECVRLDEIKSRQVFKSDGTSTLTATVGISIREFSWNTFYIPELDDAAKPGSGWNYYYLGLKTEKQEKYLPFKTADLAAYLTSLGISGLTDTKRGRG